MINRVVELIRADKVTESRTFQHTEASPLAGRLERRMNTLVNKAEAEIVEHIIWGAPVLRDDDAVRAVACALEIQLAIAAVNADNHREGLPEIHMGIGIHTGEVVGGNIGSDVRAKYGVVGRHVNITARIESCTVGSQILISNARSWS